MRVRFTAESLDWWNTVLDYAKAKRMEPSALICESLDQMMARYPKRRQPSEIDIIAEKVAEKLKGMSA
jgi:hypothetical protein